MLRRRPASQRKATYRAGALDGESAVSARTHSSQHATLARHDADTPSGKTRCGPAVVCGVSQQAWQQAAHAKGRRVASFELRERSRGRTCLLSICGELDIASAPLLHARLAEVIECGCDVILDLSECDFMDGRGLAALLGAERDLTSRRRRLIVVVAAGSSVRRVLELTQSDGILELASTPHVAIGRLAEPDTELRRGGRKRRVRNRADWPAGRREPPSSSGLVHVPQPSGS